jgi:ribosomal protein S18 acetylase RimI-like enzyme
MAAAPAIPLLVDLRQIHPQQLGPLLEEEIRDWREDLRWDYRPSAELVRRFVGMQALSGHAVSSAGRVVGYSYCVSEENKGLIGDLYLSRGWRSPEMISRLLTATVRTLEDTPGTERIEAQLMIVAPETRLELPLRHKARTHSRDFMYLDMGRAAFLQPKATGARFNPWHERWHEDAARLIPRSYQGHIDSEINDQYRSVEGARRFLHNIVQYPGCGSFFQPGSLASFDARGALNGLSLTSLVAFDVGHVTQICIAPEARGTGLGYELLRRSLESLAQAGCRGVSLTVTTSNRRAIALYEAVGFKVHRRFQAVVWELV